MATFMDDISGKKWLNINVASSTITTVLIQLSYNCYCSCGTDTGIPVYTGIYLCILVYTHYIGVHPCICVLMYTHEYCVYWYIPMYAFVYSCIPMYNGVYSCIQTSSWCIPVYTGIYLCIPMYTGVYPFILMYTGVYLCLLVYTCVYWCRAQIEDIRRYTKYTLLRFLKNSIPSYYS